MPKILGIILSGILIIIEKVEGGILFESIMGTGGYYCSVC